MAVSSVPLRDRIGPWTLPAWRPVNALRAAVATTLGKIGPGAKDAISALKAVPEDNLYKYWAEEAIKKITAQ